MWNTFVKRIGKNKSNIGVLGEDIALKWLTSKGFSLLKQNFKTFHGEIDIVVRKDNETHFVEVKSVDISRGTPQKINPKDNFTYAKSLKMAKAIEYYLMKYPNVKAFKTILLCVYIDQTLKQAKVEYIENPLVE